MYILDSNTFMEAKNRYYGFDIVPSFWKKLVEASTNQIITIDSVRDEILNGNDELTNWFIANYNAFTQSVDDNLVQTNFAKIAQYITQNQIFKEFEKKRFLSHADPWIIAYAKAYSGIVVTNEVSGGSQTKKVKIPDICKVFDVDCINVFEMMRRLPIVI